MQQELFSIEEVKTEVEEDEEDSIVCIKCDVRQPLYNFQKPRPTITKTTGEIKRTCNSCRSGHKKIIRKLKEENPYPDEDYCCPICSRDVEELSRHGKSKMSTWVLDHCHDTNTFRGWVCSHCNRGLGGFQDDLTIARKAVKYLKRHKESLNDVQITND